MKNLNLKMIVAGAIIATLFIAADYNDNKNSWKAPQEADKITNPLAKNVDASKKGGKIYNKMCWTCHGKSGKGDGPASKSLNPKPTNHTNADTQKQSDGAIYWKITNGKGVMPGYAKSLSKTQRWQLVNYIRELGK